ncbi:hypothetical protein [Sporisorium scitamineum]|uniref:Uncharacterized protein n=1 Tax=Sporisorium scitamineum TaxID=49012 RepID=A0A0F7RYJ8_9BASI|nr:hypothetical protein [Sporisorium scitamineum]
MRQYQSECSFSGTAFLDEQRLTVATIDLDIVAALRGRPRSRRRHCHGCHSLRTQELRNVVRILPYREA